MQELAIQPAAANLEMNIEAARDHFSKFNAFKKAILKENIDYGKVFGIDKPFLLQPGAQKLAKAFSLTVSVEETNRTVDVSTGFVSYEYRVTCFYGGVAVGQGVGGCNSFEDKYGFTAWVDSPEPDAATKRELASQGLGKMKPGYQGNAPKWQQRRRKSAIEMIALQNTIMKMAQKRAYVSGVLNCTGGGEFFSQDIQDMPDIVDAAQVAEAKLNEAKTLIAYAVKVLAIAVPELEQIWKLLPSFRREKWLIEMVTKRKEEITG